MSNSASRHYNRQGVVELVLRRVDEEAGAVTEVHSESRTDYIAAVVAADVDSVDDDDGVAVAGAGGSRSHGCSIEGTDYRTGHSDVHIEYNSAAAAAAAVDSLDCLFLALAVGWGTY